jgi:hypothetical protein
MSQRSLQRGIHIETWKGIPELQSLVIHRPGSRTEKGWIPGQSFAELLCSFDVQSTEILEEASLIEIEEAALGLIEFLESIAASRNALLFLTCSTSSSRRLPKRDSSL